MLTKQLSQVAISLGELKRNEGKLPATVQQPIGREIVNTVSLESEIVCQSSSVSFPAPKLDHNGSFEPITFNQVEKKEETSEQVTEKGRMVEETSVIQPSDLPPKKTDPGVFTLPISVRNIQVGHALCDLGASINIMSYSIYEKLGDAKLVHTDLIIQLAEGILENEIVKVNKFVYPADFFIIKMTDPTAEESPGVLLGRTFLSTVSTVIDVGNGAMHLHFNGERLTFDINENVRKPQNGESMQSVDTTKPRVQKNLGEEFPGFNKGASTGPKGQLKKEVDEWFDQRITEGMNYEAIEKAIMDFCKPPQSVEPNWTAKPAGVEKPPDQGTPVGRMLKEIPAPAGQLLSLPEA
ncbi:uncharacterized protein LOC121779074 [Salvia splendens]|uniref:uncharacterized protein LOC121779074 n=1 Tax=Salvia splendens TaxID=180675 RepID=UPI001C259B00|nr:uncharacterized protein LOC121779074 [Salvia splendens]